MGRFRPPRDVPDFGLKPEEQARFKAWIRTALVEIAEDLAELGRTDTSTVIEQERVDVPAGGLRRVTPPVGGMGAVLPAPTAANAGQTARIMIEAPVGTLTVESAPGVNDAGQVFLPTINGQPRATFTASGLVTFTSNGVNDWKSSAEFAAESVASRAGATAQAALDATYVLETPHPSLPNAGQATDTAEIDFSFVPGGAATWSLIDGGVPLTRLEDIPDQRVLGNDSGADGPVTPITVHQELDWLTNASTPWLFDGVDDRVELTDSSDFERTELFTISAWVQTPSVAAQQVIIGKLAASPTFQGWEFGIEAPGRLYLWLASTLVGANLILAETATGQIPVGGLVHVLVTYAGTSLRTGITLYVDSVLRATDTGVGVAGPVSGTTSSSQALEMGVRAATNTLPFSGFMPHVAIWRGTAATQTQVDEIYNAGSFPDLGALPTMPPPERWIKLDSGDATGAGGIVDHGSLATNGTAAGGLSPGSVVGSLIARSTAIWQTIPPGTDGLPLVSQGAAAIPAYEQLAMTATGALTGDVTKAAGSAVSAIAANVIVNADVNTAAAIAQTKLGALTGFAAKASGASTTTSAEPIVTYSASANMSAERVLTSGTNTTVDTSVANQIRVNVTGLTWAQVLTAGNTTPGAGAANPTVSIGDSLVFANTGSSPAGGDIQAAGDLTIASATTMHLHASGDMHVGHDALTPEVHVEAVDAIELLSPGLINESAGTTWTAQAGGNASLTSGADLQVSGTTLIRLVTGGVARLTLGSAGGWTINATEGTVGQYVRGFGAGATPQWATIAIADIPGLVSSGALSGAVTALAGGGNTTFSGILDNGAAENNRTLLNWVSGDSMSATITDDAINDELEIRQHYVGNTAEIVNSTATGNLGTVDIASLTCGGTYRVSAASSGFSIEGFTAKPVGFWFHFVVTDADQCTLFDDDATATATDRLRMPFGEDIVSTNGISGMFFYGGNTRWNWIAAGPAAIGTGSGTRVTCTSNQVNVLSSQATTIDAGTTLTATTTSGSMSFDSASTFSINTGTNDAVRLTSDSGGGFLKMAEDSASDPSVSAGDGMFWVRNDAPNVPMFTDDTNVDHQLAEVANVVNVTGATGSMGVIDISSLTSGGTVVFTSTGNFTVDGFSVKPTGFWFHAVHASVSNDVTWNGEVGATTTDLRMSGQVTTTDITQAQNGYAIFVYASSRWRGICGATP